jgi:hypothetical protein
MTASPVEAGSTGRDPLDAVREALGIPNRATVGDQEICDRILVDGPAIRQPCCRASCARTPPTTSAGPWVTCGSGWRGTLRAAGWVIVVAGHPTLQEGG